jgi:hypothetical protein
MECGTPSKLLLLRLFVFFYRRYLAQNLEAIDPTSGVYSTAAAAAILNWVFLD